MEQLNCNNFCRLYCNRGVNDGVEWRKMGRYGNVGRDFYHFGIFAIPSYSMDEKYPVHPRGFNPLQIGPHCTLMFWSR